MMVYAKIYIYTIKLQPDDGVDGQTYLDSFMFVHSTIYTWVLVSALVHSLWVIVVSGEGEETRKE